MGSDYSVTRQKTLQKEIEDFKVQIDRMPAPDRQAAYALSEIAVQLMQLNCNVDLLEVAVTRVADNS